MVNNPSVQTLSLDDESLARLQAIREQGGDSLLTQDESNALEAAFKPPELQGDFLENLAEKMDETDLAQIALEIIRRLDWDQHSRKDWQRREAQGVRLLGVADRTQDRVEDFNETDQDRDAAADEGEDEPPPGFSRVHHPLLIEACTQFQARAIAELWPPDGPVKTQVLGNSTPQRQEQADRVQGFLNYQYEQLLPDAYLQEDQALFRLPLSGSIFKKAFYDPFLKAPNLAVVEPEWFVVPYTAVDLRTAPRYTHVIKQSQNYVKKLMKAGWYRDIDLVIPIERRDEQTVRAAIDDAESTYPVFFAEDQRHTLLEMHVDWDLPGYEDKDENGEATGIGLPYVITVDRDSIKCLSIRRNWEEHDPEKRKRIWFVHKKFLPGLGFYGFGLVHAIGSLTKAARGALRALLDSAVRNNLQGGFKSRDIKLKGGDTPIAMGEFREVETSLDDIRKGLMPLPFHEPSETLFKLLGHLEEIGQRFANITEAMVGEGDTNVPVGTTLARIEQGSKVFSAIHKRLHQAAAQEFKILAELDAEYLPQRYPYDVAGETREVMAADFDDRIDVMPASDPNIVSSTQRLAQAQFLAERAAAHPDLYDARAVESRLLESARILGIDEVLPDKEDAPRMGPVEENLAMLVGKPIKVWPDQDHQAHQMVHAAWFQQMQAQAMQNPQDKALATQLQNLQGVYLAHQAEHIAWAYLIQMSQAMQVQLPASPLLTDKEKEQQPQPPVNPQQENMLAMMAAQATQLMAQQQASQQPQDPRVAQAAAEAQRKDMEASRTQDRQDALAHAEIQRQDMKVLHEMNRNNLQQQHELYQRALGQGQEQALAAQGQAHDQALAANQQGHQQALDIGSQMHDQALAAQQQGFEQSQAEREPSPGEPA
jgi:hypothetical protein